MSNSKKITKKEYLIVLLALADILLLFATMATRNSYISTCFGALVFISGMWMFLSSAQSCWQTIKTKKWVRTPYEIIELKFNMEMGSAGHFSKFTPFFKVKYNFNGITYTRSSDDNLNLPVNYVFATNKAAQEYLDSVSNYKYGEYIYVNPDEPGTGYLYTGIGRGRFGLLIFSMILLSLPVLTFTGLIVWRY